MHQEKVSEREAQRSQTESKNLLNKNPPNQLITKCEENNKVSTKSRAVLWHLMFWGFAINYMVQCNLNVTILSMVAPKSASNNSSAKLLECFNSSLEFVSSMDLYHSDDELRKYFSLERILLDLFMIDYNKNGFEWTEYEQSQCLSSFYWMFWSTQLLGGYLANRFSTKLIVGVPVFLSCGLSFFIPTAAYLNFNLLLFVRMLQGALSGFSWPAMHDITSRWISTNGTSRFMSAYMGCPIGIGLCYLIFGFVISISSWEYMFHFCAVVTVMWFACWHCCVYDNPAQNPRIESSELNHVTKALNISGQKDKDVMALNHNSRIEKCVSKVFLQDAIPWTLILTSTPFWIIVFANWGGAWQLYTLMIQLPTYFTFIHGFDIRIAGLLSGGPHVLCICFSYMFSRFVDCLLHSEILSLTNVRKFAVFVSCILSGFVCIGLAYADCNYNLAIILTFTAITLLGAQSAGVLPSIVELAPNYSSTLFGISLTVCILPGIVSPFIVGILTNNQQTIEQWKYVFLTTAGMSILSGSVYVLFASSEEQSWNNSSTSIEMKPLNKSKLAESPKVS